MSRGKNKPNLNSRARQGRMSVTGEDPRGIDTTHWSILNAEQIKQIKQIVVDDLRSHRDDLDVEEGWLFLRTGADAVEFFAKNSDLEIEAVYFDHDMGGDDTTRELALYFEERAYFNKPVKVQKIYLHTSNSSGRAWLYASLRNYPNVHKVHSDDVNLIYVGEPQTDLPGSGV